MIVPTVHLNGTSGSELLKNVTDAKEALHEAREKLARTSPNGRDYYVQGNTALLSASMEYSVREAKLREVFEELEVIQLAIVDQIEEKECQP